LNEGLNVDTKRYLIDFDTDIMEKEFHDVIIIGSGIAGVYTALEIESRHDIVILTKETIDICNSVLAQGGIAVSLDKEDSPELHFKDTIYAGAGLCREDSVWVLVNEAAPNIERICKYGVNFDRKGPEDGELVLSREAAHSKNRIVHAGDTTGKEVCDKLVSVVGTRDNIKIKERTFAVDLLVVDGSCKGLIVYDEDSAKFKVYYSNIIVCASGGLGQLYQYTTNPEVATGDGMALAYRAGAELADLEFIQFHPTVLYHPENRSFLISEAVRGEGAVLRNIKGERFMYNYHEMGELAPRDIVSRAIYSEMKKTGASHVYLDITFKDRRYLEERFPNIFKTCMEYGIDISKDYIPVAPAEHYSMGGIQTDTFGRTNIPGFYACGEVACTGIHGANRLASNSLLEGLVFGGRIGKEINRILSSGNKVEHVSVKNINKTKGLRLDTDALRNKIREIMITFVGIERNAEGLNTAREQVEGIIRQLDEMDNRTIKDFELQNMALLAKLIIESALERKESRGAHYRSDFSGRDDINWKVNIVRSRKLKEGSTVKC